MPRYWIEEEYRIECSRRELDALFSAFPAWAGTAHIAEDIDDFDMSTAANLQEDPGLHRIGFFCSVDVVPDSDAGLPFVAWARGLGDAATRAHSVVEAFCSLHDQGTWRIEAGSTRVYSSGEDEDVDHPTLSMTLHHTPRDLAMLYSTPDQEFWFSR